MIDVKQQLTINQIKALLDSYSFDTNRCSIEVLIYDWLKNYQIEWIYLATVEALFLGRYKVVSIKQILSIWERLGSPKTHFSGDFERFIGRNLPKHSSTNSINKTDFSEHQEDNVLPEEEISPAEIITDKTNNKNIDHNQNNDPENSSQAHLLNQLIQDNFPTTQISQPKLHSQPQPQDEFNFVPATSMFKNYQGILEKDNYLSPHNGIKSFSPNPDFSKFFQKLKYFADNQC